MADIEDDAERSDKAASYAAEAEKRVADENWQRYEYGRDRGHNEFCKHARRLEDYYLGGGAQWDADDLALLAEQGRPALEFNQIMPAVNAAVGYQIANRMQIGFQPRGGAASQGLADTLSKVAMQIAHNEELHWLETDVFTDGLIQQRGFYEVRVDTDDHLRGEMRVDVLDPMDVIPDPDAKAYDPDDWADVTITRWLTLDEVGQRYGQEARDKAQAMIDGQQVTGDDDFGDTEDGGEERNKFGFEGLGRTGVYDGIRRDKHLTRVRIIDRQKWVYRLCDVMIRPDTGDVEVVEDADPQRLQELQAQGAIPARRMAKRVRWIVSTYDAVLYDDWSPYPFLTVVPFFPVFRRGRTRGMVDNATGPQNALNKAASQFVHIINTTANSGWIVEENSLTNMTTEDLEDEGARSGLVVEHRKNSKEPKKIQPNSIPTGIDRMMDWTTGVLKENTVPAAARGLADGEKSGIAIQSRQFAAQQQLAIALDNLARTRKMLARRMLWCIQHYYDDERVLRITKQDPASGEQLDEMLVINQWDPETGEIINDVRAGEYDVVITEQPQQVTFENTQFDQALAMKKEGVNIPDDVLIRNSNLAEKAELLKRMAQQQEKADPLTDAKVRLTEAQTRKADADAVARGVEAQYSGIQTAQTIAQIPQTAGLADALLLSAGFVDRDNAPIVPQYPGEVARSVPSKFVTAVSQQQAEHTNPMTPANPASALEGVREGIETPEADGVQP